MYVYECVWSLVIDSPDRCNSPVSTGIGRITSLIDRMIRSIIVTGIPKWTTIIIISIISRDNGFSPGTISRESRPDAPVINIVVPLALISYCSIEVTLETLLVVGTPSTLRQRSADIWLVIELTTAGIFRDNVSYVHHVHFLALDCHGLHSTLFGQHQRSTHA